MLTDRAAAGDFSPTPPRHTQWIETAFPGLPREPIARSILRCALNFACQGLERSLSLENPFQRSPLGVPGHRT